MSSLSLSILTKALPMIAPFAYLQAFKNDGLSLMLNPINVGLSSFEFAIRSRYSSLVLTSFVALPVVEFVDTT